MKRIFIAVILLIAIIVGCVLSYRFLDRTAVQLAQSVAAAQSAAETGNYTAASLKLAKATEKWDAVHPVLGILLHHDVLNDIDELFVRTKYALSENKGFESRQQLYCLQEQLLHLPDAEQLTLENLL